MSSKVASAHTLHYRHSAGIMKVAKAANLTDAEISAIFARGATFASGGPLGLDDDDDCGGAVAERVEDELARFRMELDEGLRGGLDIFAPPSKGLTAGSLHAGTRAGVLSPAASASASASGCGNGNAGAEAALSPEAASELRRVTEQLRRIVAELGRSLAPEALRQPLLSAYKNVVLSDMCVETGSTLQKYFRVLFKKSQGSRTPRSLLMFVAKLCLTAPGSPARYPRAARALLTATGTEDRLSAREKEELEKVNAFALG